METNTAVAVKSIHGLLKQDNVMSRIEALLGSRAPQFTSSLLSLVNSSRALGEADPKTVLAAAMTAATLDLPINQNLGFAHIIPYGGVGQFQMGYKGFIQLAMRTGQYERMNAVAVNSEAVGGMDCVGEPIILWDKIDESKPVVGYVFAFRLVNGFTKVSYWSKSKVEAHAQKYSQAYRAKKKDSPWITNFDSQGLKTVIKNTLAKWGILSVEMQRAIDEDAGTRKDLDDSGPMYLDNTIDGGTVEPEKKPSIRERATKEEKAEPTQNAMETLPLNDEIKALYAALPATKIQKAMSVAGIKWQDGEELEQANEDTRKVLLGLLKAAK